MCIFQICFNLKNSSVPLSCEDFCFSTFNLNVLHVCVFKDRVVDDLNPGLNFTRKEVESLLHFVEEEVGQFSLAVQEDFEEVMYQACKLYPHLITKVQSHFTHDFLI